MPHDDSERKQIEEAKTLDAKSAYEVIRQEGASELARPASAQATQGEADGG